LTEKRDATINPMSSAAVRSQPQMSPSDVALWGALIASRCGMHFGESRERILRRALSDRMTPAGVTSYRRYHDFVSSEAGQTEWESLVEDLSNRETSFFRHLPSYTALRDEILPEIVSRKVRDGDRALSLWSAGCSTGQEAYSMAMVAVQAAPPPWRIAVEASDISHRALEATRTARYRRFASSPALPTAATGFLKLAVGPHGESFHEVAAPLRMLVRPSWFNLVEPTTYPAGPFDVIFCQNVLIYFGLEWRARVLDALVDRLAPGGYLAPAPGEAAGLKPAGGEPRSFGDALVFRRVS